MRRQGFGIVLIAVVTFVTGGVLAQGGGRGPQGPPDIVGKWTGTWTSFNPAQATTQPRELCKKLDASVVRNGDAWTATFEGDCTNEFIGFYTSASSTGYFNLKKIP